MNFTILPTYITMMRSLLSLVPLMVTTATAVAIANPVITARAAATGNPFSGYQMYVNSYYGSEVSASAIPSMTGSAAAAASSAAKVPSFYWL